MNSIRDHIPNLLSLSRIPASGLFLWFFTDTEAYKFWVAIAVAIISLVTDIADGYLARKWGLTSEAGYFLDGMGDKCFTVAICLVIARIIPNLELLSWALIIREVILYALRAIDQEKQDNIKKLRSFSLLQAGSIRVFFLIFFCISAAKVHGLSVPLAASWMLITTGVFSGLCGWATIFFIGKGLFNRANDTQ